jgi:chemotaxis signal transduction protein
MSAADRLVTFEVGGTVYALPIHGVLEVADAGRITSVPTLPRRCGGVMNWHGDALPVVSPGLIFEGCATDECDAEHVLVISDRSGETARLGIPVDRVLGLVDGATRPGRGTELVVERRPVEGRVVNVLDPRRLVALAETAIESSVH